MTRIYESLRNQGFNEAAWAAFDAERGTNDDRRLLTRALGIGVFFHWSLLTYARNHLGKQTRLARRICMCWMNVNDAWPIWISFENNRKNHTSLHSFFQIILHCPFTVNFSFETFHWQKNCCFSLTRTLYSQTVLHTRPPFFQSTRGNKYVANYLRINDPFMMDKFSSSTTEWPFSAVVPAIFAGGHSILKRFLRERQREKSCQT